MLRFVLLILLLNAVNPLIAQSPKPIKSLLDKPKLKKITYSKGNLGHIESTNNNGTWEYLVSTDTFVENQFNLAVNIPLLKQNIAKGEKILLSFSAKTLSSSIETGEARVAWVLSTNENISGKVRKISNIPQDWKKIYVLFEAERMINIQHLGLNMQFGFPPQQFLIKDINVELYSAKIDATQLPKTQIFYPGMEAEATWRKDAIGRIEKIRMGDIQFVVSKNGKPVPNAKINIEMVDHHFKWGAAIRAEKMNDDNIDQFRKYFNMAVFENDLKMKHWEKNKDATLQVIDRLRDRDIAIKGHVLVWPGFRYLPDAYLSHKNNPKKINDMTNAHVKTIIEATKGKIDVWDVVNECYTNKDLQTITGSNDILYRPFTILKAKDPNALRYVNEYGIISGGGINTVKQDWYYKFIQELDRNTGGAVDGIGMQSHIGYDLTPPQKVIDILDRFGTLGKRISISEFTLDIDDPLVRRMYTEDFLIAAFSHPNVHEFLFWGYQGDQNSKVDIITKDGRLGSMGQGYWALVHGLWKSKANGTTSQSGTFNDRGYYGKYQYTITLDGKTQKGTFMHIPTETTAVKVEMN